MSAAGERARKSLAPEVTDEVRRAVRGMLETAPAFREAGGEKQRELAQGLVDLGLVAAGLIDDERKSGERLKRRAMATAMSAGDQLGMQATRAAAGTLTGLRDAIDFPNYVGSLITGVFQAILNSSTQQLGSISDLVQSVGVSAEDYARSVDDSEVARWLVAKFPRLLVSPDGSTVQAAANVDLSEHATELSAVLGGDGDVTDPDSLLDLGRQKMAADKQRVLATMMKLGMQRIVVDEGQIHTSMDLRVDASSQSEEAKAQRDDWRVNAGASGSFTNGMWGASASASTSIGQVKSDAQLTSEQIAARAGLRSSVDLAFRTQQISPDGFASPGGRVHLSNAAAPVDVSGASTLPPMQQLAAPSLDVPPTPPPPALPQSPLQRAAGQAGGAQGGQGQNQGTQGGTQAPRTQGTQGTQGGTQGTQGAQGTQGGTQGTQGAHAGTQGPRGAPQHSPGAGTSSGQPPNQPAPQGTTTQPPSAA